MNRFSFVNASAKTFRSYEKEMKSGRQAGRMPREFSVKIFSRKYFSISLPVKAAGRPLLAPPGDLGRWKKWSVRRYLLTNSSSTTLLVAQKEAGFDGSSSSFSWNQKPIKIAVKKVLSLVLFSQKKPFEAMVPRFCDKIPPNLFLHPFKCDQGVHMLNVLLVLLTPI